MDPEIKLAEFLPKPYKLEKISIGSFDIRSIEIGSGTPLLLLHGANIGWGQWYKNIEEFSKKFRVYALDFPGSGNSTKVEYKKMNHDKIYQKVVKEYLRIKKIEKFSIVAHSIGASVAIKIAANSKKIYKIVLINPVGFYLKIPLNQKLLSIYPIAQFLSKTVMRPTRNNIKKFLTDSMIHKNKLDNNFTDYYFSVAKEKGKHPFLFINSLTEKFSLKKNLLFLSEIKKIHVPVLIILGEKDILMNIRKITEVINDKTNFRIEVIKDTGHVPFIEKSNQFNSVVMDFLLSTT